MKYIERESYKHKFAKTLICEWLNARVFSDFICDRAEMEYSLRSRAKGKSTKVADVAAFKDGCVCAIFEVYHTHRIEKKKLDKLLSYWPEIMIYEISADMLLNLTAPPSTILNLCEYMNGNIPSQKRKAKKSTKSYMFVEEVEESPDNRYLKLMQ